MHNAVLTASVMWGLANRDDMLPRFAPSEMPAVPAGRGGGRGAAPSGPVALPHIYALAKGRPLVVRAPGLVETGGRGFANASASPATASIVTKPAHGKLALNPDGSFTYTPGASFTGADSFTYTVSSGGATSEPATITFVVK